MNNNIVELEHMNILSFNRWTKENKNNFNKIIYDKRTDLNNPGTQTYKRIRVDYNPNTIYLLDDKKDNDQYCNYVALKNVEHVLKIDKDNYITLMIKCQDNSKEHIVVLE